MMGWHGLSGALSVTSYHTHGHACGESVPPSTGGTCGSRNYAFDRHRLKTFAGQRRIQRISTVRGLAS